MTILSRATRIVRSPRDPKILRTGASSRTSSDRIAHALGWFSLALGAVELIAPRHLARTLGMEGKESLLRAYGLREVAAGMTVLSPDKAPGLWSRVGGDLLDIATLSIVYTDRNPKRHNVGLALAAVVAITLLDLAAAKASTTTHSRGSGPWRDYSNRSGWPKGLEAARAARSSNG